MNQNQKALLELLKASLFGIEPEFPEDADWDAVLAEAKAQTVVALAAKTVPKEVASEWQRSALQNQANFVRVLHGQTQLVNLLEQEGIPLVILKGTAAAVYYPEPFRRSMGDVDFLVPQDRFEEAMNLMIANGYREIGNGPRHTEFVKDGIEYELHRRYSPLGMDVEEYITEGFSCLETGNVGKDTFPILPCYANGIVLLTHLCAHLKKGVGLRQMIDWMMYVDRVLDDKFWESEFRQAAESIGLASLAITVTRMCQRYLGLSDRITWCFAANESLCDQLLELLLSSGNFGRKNGEGGHVEAVGTRIRAIGLFNYLQSTGETSWKAYKRYHFLKPFCWIYRGFQLAKRVMKTGRGMSMVEDIDRSKDRYELLKSLGVY